VPNIKRYGPLAHGFNRDPQVRELRKKYADWMGYVWQELTLIADLNGGVVTGTPEQIGESLAYISLTKRPSLSAKCITNALGFMEKCGWIAVQTDRVLVLNYLKYHPKETVKKVPTNEQTNEQTNEVKNQDAKGDAKGVVSNLVFQPTGLNPLIKEVADRIFLSNRPKFAKLIVWIKEAQKEKYRDDVIATALMDFERYASRIDNWWKYLDGILNRVEKNINAKESKLQSELHKQELKDFYVETQFGKH